jgi:hypothetical protein
MGWDRSSDFKALLEKCSRKASRNAIEELAAMAMMDHRQVRALTTVSIEIMSSPLLGLHPCSRQGSSSGQVPAALASQCYKAVPAMISKQFQKAHDQQRVNILYAVSKILRSAKKQLKGENKYGTYDGVPCPALAAHDLLATMHLMTQTPSGNPCI